MVSFRDSVPLCNKTNCDRLEPDSGADFAAASMAASSSSHADSEALYYHHDDSLPTDLEPNYNLQALPLAGLTAASAQCGNLFPTPQTLLTSTSSSLELELPVSMPCNTVTPSAMDSGSVFFWNMTITMVVTPPSFKLTITPQITFLIISMLHLVRFS